MENSNSILHEIQEISPLIAAIEKRMYLRFRMDILTG